MACDFQQCGILTCVDSNEPVQPHSKVSSFVGNQEIKTSNKTKEEIVEGFSLRVTTPSCACKQVLEVETDLADSGAHQDQTETPGW